MADKFTILPLPQLLQIVIDQYDKTKSIFGIPEELFFIPNKNDSFRTSRFGQMLENPVGVAAGPHTQLAQNIVAAWLTGARFIELKTIQTLDELDIPKPCIDMQDEGYNCEWSQELKIKESFDQYLNAWIIIHVLKDKLKIGLAHERGFIFNMSVGYDLDGILKDNVNWFFQKMADASYEIKYKLDEIKVIYPDIQKLNISPKISNNVTLSTMHGCPPDEIEKIGEYLIGEKKIHTSIKLNPTLLGKDELMEIIKASGFETEIPHIAFEHDLKYEDALGIIKNLQIKANKNDLHFGLKLTNTLESLNHKDIFSSQQEMIYMSGRVLHPVSIKVAQKLQNEFKGKLDISFSGGANAFNVADIIKCGLHPVTVCTDLLKPGGYGRLNQYFVELRKQKVINPEAASFKYLNNYANKVIQNKDYKKTEIHDPSIKTSRALCFFDCIHAPCEDSCPTNQDIPGYMHYTAKGDFDKAAEIILGTNPFPKTTGMVCDHICQTKCTRINYDGPLLIREIKRFVAENSFYGSKKISSEKKQAGKVAIIGAGPSGLSCAYFLRKAGFRVDVYESKPKPGGMVSGAIPSFRLTDEAFTLDVNYILELGVNIEFNHFIDKSKFLKIRSKSDFIYIAAGAQKSKELFIQFIPSKNILDPLEFLFNVKMGYPTAIGKNVIVIGGGNTAMDTARTAYRLVGENGKVRIIYRRTIKQMPADTGEIKAVLDEGIEILELTDPVEAKSKKHSVVSISCRKMKLGEKDASGRARPIPIKDSEFELKADTIIPAIGQDLDIDFVDVEQLETQNGSYETKLPNVFIGGDAMRGASTAINAIGDGRKAAQEIINNAHIGFNTRSKSKREEKSFRQHIIDKAKRIEPQQINETELSERKNFNLVTTTLSKEEAIAEASRCLLCDEVCNVCTTVCPNLALMSYNSKPVNYKLQKLISKNGKFEIEEDQIFSVKQKIQILHLADWCNECGNCTTFCPSAGSPYKDKPHLFFSKKSFENADDGFYFDKQNNELSGKEKGQEFSLIEKSKSYIYKTKLIEININKNDFRIIDFQTRIENNTDIYMRKAAEMSVVLQGVVEFSQ
ncbi:MAG: putative selenate reductase subunit YgfK [Bacteroidota bacterium]|nr:putative selenate reductase subunit YgfK [Bacteroidota bacterium]